VAILAACGGEEPAQPAANAGPAGAAAGSAGAGAGTSRIAATAEKVAAESRGKVKCPAKIQSPPRAADAPVDDVLGVRPGMTYEEAANLVMCSHDLLVVNVNTRQGFKIQTYGQTLRQGFSARFAKPRINQTSQEIMKEMQDRTMASGTNRVVRDMEPGQAKWHVGTMGMPGEERVISVGREEWFAEGRNPTLDSVAQALVTKYGTPTSEQTPGYNRYMEWSYDALGRPITETSPLYGRCRGNADPDAGVNLTPDCALVVTANVSGTRENPQIAQYMQVGVVDQGTGYAALMAAEQGLQAMEDQRRAQQVEEAARNADAPQL
jgi:hypothetical protein